MAVELIQADYARRRGVSPNAIGKAIDAGRIPADAVRRVGRQKWIDVAKADFALGASSARVNTPAELPLDAATAAEPLEAAPVRETPGLTLARTRQAEVQADIAALDLQRRLGQVLETADVTRSMERCAEAFLRDLGQLSGRADDVTTAALRQGVDGVRRLLKSIERELRATVAANMRILTTADDDDAEQLEADQVDDLADPLEAADQADDQAGGATQAAPIGAELPLTA